MEINPQDVATLQIYKILTGSIMPRPIAWVSTLNSLGHPNLAPFSFFTVASVQPPVLCFCPLLNDDRREKDTLVNIRQSREFVINIVSHPLVEKMNQTSAPYPAGVSEFAQAGVTVHPSTVVKAPGVQESLVRFECTLNQIISFGSDPMAGALVLGDICRIHLQPAIYQDGRVDFEALDPVGRLVGSYYSTIRDRFEIARPQLLPEG